MKRNLIGLVVKGTIVCNLGLIGSVFFKFMTAGKHVGDESFSVRIFDIFKLEEQLFQQILVVMMGIGVIVSFVAMNAFTSSKDAVPSTVMLVNAIVGFCCYRSIDNVFLGYANQGYNFINEELGRFLMKISYVGLILLALIALGIDIYSAYTKNNTRNREQVSGTGANVCPRCGKKISTEGKFCDTCGFSLASLTCPNCGAKRNSTSVFCKECGERLPVLNMKKTGE